MVGRDRGGTVWEFLLEDLRRAVPTPSRLSSSLKKDVTSNINVQHPTSNGFATYKARVESQALVLEGLN